MSTPTFSVTSAPLKEASNPLGLLRLDHIQICGGMDRLETLYRRLGFVTVKTVFKVAEVAYS